LNHERLIYSSEQYISYISLVAGAPGIDIPD
jgi:hypothetical protein